MYCGSLPPGAVDQIDTERLAMLVEAEAIGNLHAVRTTFTHNCDTSPPSDNVETPVAMLLREPLVYLGYAWRPQLVHPEKSNLYVALRNTPAASITQTVCVILVFKGRTWQPLRDASMRVITVASNSRTPLEAIEVIKAALGV